MAVEQGREHHHVDRCTSAVVAGTTSVVAIVGSPVPALAAENYAEDFAQGVGNIAQGPALLALPIVVGFLVATAIAAFIFYISQPREYDD